MSHTSVMLQESIEYLAIQPAGVYVDATFGRGGHSMAILDKLDKDGKLIVLDRDPEAIEVAQKLAAQDSRVVVFKSPFSELYQICKQEHILGQVSGVLLDLGVSSCQLDQPARGFSFMQSGPLDMRMDPNSGISAADWLEKVEEQELITVLKEYGEERFAKRIASSIINNRKEKKITRTDELVDIIVDAIPFKEKHKHPATRSFQAIRIAVNNEFNELKQVLSHIVDVLAVNGRLVVISFHSLEDRIVKHFIQGKTKINDKYPTGLPIRYSEMEKATIKKIGKALKARDLEIKNNRRSRSAIMRVMEKL